MAKLNITVPHTDDGAVDQHLHGLFCERVTFHPDGSRSYEHVPVRTLRFDRETNELITPRGERVAAQEPAA